MEYYRTNSNLKIVLAAELELELHYKIKLVQEKHQ